MPAAYSYDLRKKAMGALGRKEKADQLWQKDLR